MALGCLLGCDQATPAASGTTGPPPHVVWTYPANEATDVPLTFSIRVQFDRFLMPSTATRQSLCLQAATVGGESTGTDQCISAGFAPEYDPVDRVATWVIRGAIMERTRYNVRLFAPKDVHDANGVRAFDGTPLEKEFTFAFTTRKSGSPAGSTIRRPFLPKPVAPEPPDRIEPPRTLDFCPAHCPLPDGRCDKPMSVPVTSSPHEFLAKNCTSGGNCHGGGSGAQGPSGSVLRLDDDGAGGGIVAAVRHLVDHAVVASETATGADPVTPSRNVLAPFGHNMPYIDATNPGNSFLLYKIILAMAPRCPFDPNEESATHTDLACDSSAPARWRYAQDFYDCRSVSAAGLEPDPLGNCPGDGGFPPLPKIGEKGELISPLLEPRVPADAWQPPARGEYDRLRTRIRGAGMPQGGLVSHAEALAMSAWIADGARVEPCP